MMLNIKETMWVQSLKTENFNTSTNNRLESFFQKLKSILPLKESIEDLLAAFLGLLVTIRTECHYRALSAASKVPTNSVQCGVLLQFSVFFIPFGLKQVTAQIEASKNVTFPVDNVLSASECTCHLSQVHVFAMPPHFCLIER